MKMFPCFNLLILEKEPVRFEKEPATFINSFLKVFLTVLIKSEKGLKPI